MLTDCQVNSFVMKLLLPPLCTCMGHMTKWLRAWVPAKARHELESPCCHLLAMGMVKLHYLSKPAWAPTEGTLAITLVQPP